MEATSSRSSDGYLTAERVRDVYAQCYRDESVRVGTAQVEAWLLRHTFSVRMLQRSREQIVRMLLSLNRGFRTDERGGGSVAAATMRGDSTFWTGDMADVEKLIALGVASGLVSFCAPREKWDALPGGLPYVRLEITRFGVSVN